MAYSFIFLTVAVGILFILLRGAPFVPTAREQVLRMVELSRVLPGEKAADIGSGDGRIAIAFAQAGAKSHGYEIKPWLVWLGRRNIKKAGLENRASIHWKDFWSQNFSSFDIVTVYGINHIMKRLERKLRKELKPGARVVLNSFKFPTWEPIKSQNNLHLYIKD